MREHSCCLSSLLCKWGGSVLSLHIRRRNTRICDQNIQASQAIVPWSNRAWCLLVLLFDFAHAVFVPLSTVFSLLPLVENLIVSLRGFSVEVGISIRGGDAFMAGKHL